MTKTKITLCIVATLLLLLALNIWVSGKLYETISETVNTTLERQAKLILKDSKSNTIYFCYVVAPTKSKLVK